VKIRAMAVRAKRVLVADAVPKFMSNLFSFCARSEHQDYLVIYNNCNDRFRPSLQPSTQNLRSPKSMP
jgi:hypothetical protein